MFDTSKRYLQLINLKEIILQINQTSGTIFYNFTFEKSSQNILANI